MKKYAYRLIVALLAFGIGLTTVSLFGCAKIIKSIFPGPVHSSENNSPYALLEARTIRIKPYDAMFEIPESWLEPTSPRNLYLTWEELNYLYRNDGADDEDAQVINSVLPFEYCAAHVGSKDWGNHFWNDLQGRVYFVELSAEEIDQKVAQQGLRTAKGVFESASLSSENFGVWQRRTLDVVDAPTHFILSKKIDFYYHRFNNKTVVFVFVHAPAGKFGETINQILTSFRWPGGT